MYVVKVLKRKDATSVALAILLAFITLNPLQNIPQMWSVQLVLKDEFGSDFYGDWRQTYIVPLLTLVFQLIIIELGLRLVIFLRARLVRRK